MRINRILITAGGTALILFGLVMLLLQVENTLEWEFGVLAFLVLVTAGLIGLLSHGRVSRLGKLGLWLAVLSPVLITALFLFESRLPELPWDIFPILFFCLPVGIGIFGIAALRSRPFNWGNGLPLLAAASLVALFQLNPALPVWVSQAATFLLALSWMALGYTLIVSSRRPAEVNRQPAQSSRKIVLGGL
ncbi:MAG: hypothetical protein R3335_06030, partial [Anaerolineales bacterium]|nr:hypothetical protein [Anaerolineales bacterium]